MKFAEFFAGVGLVREGLSNDGWSCSWANDISEHKQETYLENYGKGDFLLEDIWNVAKQPEQIPNDIFLYTASFPCTDLSVAGDRAGLAGEESGTLNALLKIITEKKRLSAQPKIVMLENVKGFITSHQGQDIENTVKAFNNLGYVVDIVELDAAMFTPQSRPRVFMIAVEQDLSAKVMKIKSKGNILDTWWNDFYRHPEVRSNKLRDLIQRNEKLSWGLFDIPTPEKHSNKIDTIVEAIPDDSLLWWNSEKQQYLFDQMSEAHQKIVTTRLHDSEYFYGTVYRRMRKGRSMAELRSDGIAGCLRTPRGGSSKQILVRVGKGGWKARLMTPREYARLQGVRDCFKMPENANKGYFAMGDGVCVPAIKHLSRYILKPAYIAWKGQQQNEYRKTA